MDGKKGMPYREAYRGLMAIGARSPPAASGRRCQAGIPLLVTRLALVRVILVVFLIANLRSTLLVLQL